MRHHTDHTVAPAARRGRLRRPLAGHRLPVCAASGKRRFRDRAQAQDALQVCRRTRGRDLDRGVTSTRTEQRSYPCPDCDGWHLTSRPSWRARSTGTPVLAVGVRPDAREARSPAFGTAVSAARTAAPDVPLPRAATP